MFKNVPFFLQTSFFRTSIFFGRFRRPLNSSLPPLFQPPPDIFSKGPICSFTKIFPQKLAFSNLGQTGRNRADRDFNNSMFFFHSVNTELTFADSWGPINQAKT